MCERLSEFVAGYVECALWLARDNQSYEPLDLDVHEWFGSVPADVLAEMRADCEAFFASAEEEGWLEDERSAHRAGHDFFLTRNRHGAGFWDGDWAHGDELTELAHPYGTQELIVDEETGRMWICH